jgi:hypothetical protein
LGGLEEELLEFVMFGLTGGGFGLSL